MAEGMDLDSLIKWGREERHLEYKASLDWTDTATKEKLTKSVLAMANLRDGGHVILGVERQPDDTYDAVGMRDEHLQTFVQDNISAHFAEFADPYIEASLIKHSLDGKIFVIIRINEFAELPVICKKDGKQLRRGATYIRSRRIPETVEVPSQVEMREILDLAIEKRNRTFTRQAGRMGLIRAPQTDEFVDQLKALPETKLLKRIWSMGRWRVYIRPTVFEKAHFQNLNACRAFMMLNSINSGGLIYPHILKDGIDEGDEWIASEVSPENFLFPAPHLERWVLFRSGQFVHNFAFAEDFIGTEAWPIHPQIFVPGDGKRYLNILRTLMIVTCVFELAARMASRQLLNSGALISLELHRVDGRELSYMQAQRRLDAHYFCRAENVQVDRLLNSEELSTRPRELALDATLEIFRNFNWLNPPKNLLADEQSRLLND
jgi:hypothetical protein